MRDRKIEGRFAAARAGEHPNGGRTVNSMVISAAVLFGFFGLAGQVTSTASRPPADAEAELRRLTERRFAANLGNDRAFYERLLAPNFVILPGNEPPLTKSEYLEKEFPAGRTTIRRVDAVISDLKIHVADSTAAVSYRVAEPTMIGDQRFESRSTRVDTYARIEGSWRLLSMAAADVVTWPDVAALDPRLLNDYAGTYEMSPGYLIVITNESGHLMAEVSGQTKVELFPENDTTFFDKTDSAFARTVFERDRSGKVVAQIYRAQGQKVRAKKIR